jgi:hypothetical protein
MARYQAENGVEDRNGEMTGAITFNMIMVVPAVTAWSIFLGPRWFSVEANVAIGIAMAACLTVAGIPISRRIWAHVSEWMDRQEAPAPLPPSSSPTPSESPAPEPQHR